MAGSILVVDDDGAFGALLEDVLTDAGYAVQVYTDSQAALVALRSGEVQPNVVLIDLVMPAPTGRDFIVALRADAALRAIPVVLISALPVPNLAASLGTAAVLRKPVAIQDVLQIVAQLS